MNPPRVSLIVTVGERLRLLRHFLAHYQRLGVQRFIFNYEFEENTSLIDTVSSVASEMGCVHLTGTIHRGLHYSRISFANVQRAFRQHASPNEWFLYPDLDEFFEVPMGLPEALDQLEGEDLVLGTLVDRVSDDGELKTVEVGSLLEDLFPLGSYITRDLLKAPVKNVAMTRGFSPVSKHVELCPTSRDKRAADLRIRIHHFKWTDTVTRTLERRAKRYQAFGYPWWKESDAALRHLRKNGGAFDIEHLDAFRIGTVLGV